MSEIVASTGLSQPNVSNHLARFRQRGWVQATRSGRQIYYQITDPALAAYIERHERGERILPEAERERMTRGALKEYVEAARRSRPDLAERVIEGLVDAGLTWQELYLDFFMPALRHVGELWERGELSVAAEHAATAFSLRLMGCLTPPRLPADQKPIGTLVIGCVEGERHSVGALIVADFFRASGWDVRNLGADVPTDEFLGFIRSVRPDAVGVSATIDASGSSLREFVTRFHALRGDARQPLLMGGGQWIDRNANHRLRLDLCDGDLRSLLPKASRRLHRKE